MLYLSGKVRPDLPAMLTPRMGQRPPPGMPWAADTGCFNRPQDHDDDRYLAWLATMPEGCLFATAPDVVGDAEVTLARSLPMLPRIRAIVPVALVAQDGLTPDMVPWDDIDALFIGGTTAWKLGPDVPLLVAEARRRGKWTHMGRVNSWKRYEHARSMGCDSVDGTYLRFDPALKRSPGPAGWMDRATREPHIWEGT